VTKRRKVRSLGVKRAGEMSFFELEHGPPAAGQFWVNTHYSGLSAGTELTFFKGSNPYLRARWDDDLCLFCEGEPKTTYPIKILGYMEVGQVVETHTPAVCSGELVAMAYGHKTGHLADAAHEFFVPLPADLDPLLGIYVAQMGPICANGLLHAAVDLVGQDVRQLGEGVTGRNVLITGGGVVGLLTGLFARHYRAATVAVIDRSPQRLAAAEGLGLVPIDENNGEAWRYCKERWQHGPRDRGADVVFQCRGRTTSLSTALRSLRPQGTVIDLAFYQGGAPEVRLGEEFHHNGLTVRCAQIGRVPRGLSHIWDRGRLARETIDLLGQWGAAIREHLVTDVVPLEEAPGVIADLAERRRQAIQVVFQVTDEGPALRAD
jgi:threonine dehydrogenase-like Zn-dependent dehydrogenase